MEKLERVKVLGDRIEVEIGRHIIGQKELIQDTLICLFAGGNLLLEGVPGLGKTRLVRVLGEALGLDSKRIQFTPDLMPADITGTNIYNKDTGMFEFQNGPVLPISYWQTRSTGQRPRHSPRCWKPCRKGP